jgi:hypothetical protein
VKSALLALAILSQATACETAICALGQCGCSDVGCYTGPRLNFTLPGIAPSESGPSEITNTQFELCLNDDCATGYLEDWSTALNPSIRVHPADPDTWIRFEAYYTTEGVELEPSFHSDDLSRYRDGDVYSVRIVSPSGVELVNRAWSSTYRTVQPNGPDCEPTCRVSALQEL